MNTKQQIQELIIEGLSRKEIMDRLGISKNTFHFHKRSLKFIEVRRDHIELLLKFFIDNADSLPNPTDEMQDALNSLYKAKENDRN